MCWSVFYCIFRNFSQYFYFQFYISFSVSYFMCIRQQHPPPLHYPLDHFKSWCCRPALTLQWFKWNCVFSITGQGCENSRWHHDNCKTNAVLWTERCYQNGVYTILTMLLINSLLLFQSTIALAFAILLCKKKITVLMVISHKNYVINWNIEVFTLFDMSCTCLNSRWLHFFYFVAQHHNRSYSRHDKVCTCTEKKTYEISIHKIWMLLITILLSSCLCTNL